MSFSAVEAVSGTVERSTVLLPRQVHIVDVRLNTGPRVVARVAAPVKDGATIPVSALDMTGGAAFVPAGDEESLPRALSPMRDLPMQEFTIPALLTRQAERYGDKPLIVCDGETWTFRDVLLKAGQAAAGLESRGVATGDRVATLCGNRLELLETILGCAWIGAVAVPLNAALRGNGLRHTLADSGARVLVAERSLAAHLQDIDIPASLDQLWLLDGEPDHPGAAARALVREDGCPIASMPFPREGRNAPAAGRAPGDTLAILYTSGTTGLPKGVCCPHAQFCWWALLVGESMEIGAEDTLFTCLPLFHTNALNAFFQAVAAGATFVLGRRFSASRFWAEAAACGATVTYLLGAMVQILRAQPQSAGDRAHSVTRALAPGTPADAWVDFRERYGVTLIEGYGSTETNLVIGAGLRAQEPGYMGMALPDFDIRVVDDTGLDVPDGEPGELVCRSHLPYAFGTGYFENPTATVAAWRDLWFHTGDSVVRHASGRIQFMDRLSDSIRRRGENISSLEVEQVLAGHPSVESVAVFAVASELSEDEVMAAVVIKEGATFDPADLTRWCESRLAYFAIPRYVTSLDEMPLTQNGKVRKSDLRTRGVTDTTWDRTRT